MVDVLLGGAVFLILWSPLLTAPVQVPYHTERQYQDTPQRTDRSPAAPPGHSKYSPKVKLLLGLLEDC